MDIRVLQHLFHNGDELEVDLHLAFGQDLPGFKDLLRSGATFHTSQLLNQGFEYCASLTQPFTNGPPWVG